MGCRSCGGRRSIIEDEPDILERMERMSNNNNISTAGTDTDFIMVRYTSSNTGDHPVVGNMTGLKYGYRCGGDAFLVHRRDVQGNPDLFDPIDIKYNDSAREYGEVITEKNIEATTKELPAEIESVTTFLKEDISIDFVDDENDLLGLPDMTENLVKILNDNGIFTVYDIVKVKAEGLIKCNGIGKVKSFKIYYASKKVVDERNYK